MKVIARLLLFLFLTFLSTPTIVRMIEKSCDTSLIFSLSEEEHAKKDFKVFDYYSSLENVNLLCIDNKSSLILSENLSKHDKIISSVFSPPPDLV